MFKYRITSYLLLIACMLGISIQVWAQPDWSVNASNFQYTMTVTGVALFQCQESFDEGDIVAAFIDGECRGVQAFNTNVDGRILAYLTVYDNVPIGNNVNFKLYDASTNEVFEDVFPTSFEENRIIGNPASPHEFKTDFVLTDLTLSNGLLYDYDVAGTAFTEVLSINENGDTTAFMIDFVDDEDGIDNSFFSAMGSQLILEQDVDYKNKKEYQIHIDAISDAGCEVDKVITIPVENTNVPPTDLKPDEVAFNENEEEGTLITELMAVDESTTDIHTFTLVGDGIEWPDNSLFQIVDNELLSATVFDYETRETYSIQIEISDRVGNIYVDTLKVDIQDVIELDDLKANNLVTPNDDGINDFFEIPNVDLFCDYELTIFNDNGNKVYQTKCYQNDWDGKNDNGTELVSGTYYYTIRQLVKKENDFRGRVYLYRKNQY
jgi:gliding motility-associated-like protein